MEAVMNDQLKEDLLELTFTRFTKIGTKDDQYEVDFNSTRLEIHHLKSGRKFVISIKESDPKV